MQLPPAPSGGRAIRGIYDVGTETCWLSVLDVVPALTRQPDSRALRIDWKVLKNQLTKEEGESVTECNRLKLSAADGESCLPDVVTAETLLRLVQDESFS